MVNISIPFVSMYLASQFDCKRGNQLKISKQNKILFADLKKIHGTKGTGGSPAL